MATGYFYTFSKRKNSTAQPSGGTSVDLQLKSGTSLISPTFLLESSSKPSYNYVQFEGRYYFVNDVISVRNNLWEIDCNVDVLATYKTAIGSTSAMILYATGGSSDIADKRIGMTKNVVINTNGVTIPGITISSLGAGSVVLSTTGVGSFGDFYLDDRSKLPELLDGVDNWIQAQGWHGVDDMMDQLVYGGSAAECVKNCIGLPFSLSDTSFSGNVGPNQQLVLGKYPCADSGGAPIYVHRIVNPVYHVSKNITIPWEYSDFRRQSPYTNIYLYLPFIGVLSISPDEVIGQSSLDIIYAFNLASGDISVEVSTADPYKIIATCSTNVAMGMTFGSANVTTGMIASAVVTGIGAIGFAAATALSGGSLAVAGGALFGGITAAAGGILAGLGGDTHGGGGLSGGASGALSDHIQITTVSRQLTDSPANVNDIMGRPVFAKHTVGTYSGFVQTSGFEVSGAMLDQERDTINSFLDGGIYYE